jgi:hypothetical protein
MSGKNENENENENDLELELLDDAGQVAADGDNKDDDPDPLLSAEDDQDGADDHDEEIAQYGANVQKRIKKLTYERHEERRARESAESLREEALEYAKKIQAENEALRQTLSQGETVLVKQATSRLAAEIAAQKKAYKEAYDAGDSDALVEAQTALTNLQNEEFRVKNYRPQQNPKTTQEPQQPQVPRPDNLAVEWGKKNDWFQKDRRMTGFAMGVHEELVTTGVDPRSKEYYDKIDEAMKDAFPDKFASPQKREAQPRRTGSVVAPANRSAKSPRKVQLTPTQVSLAKRLGISLEDYAKQVLKDSQDA